MSVASLIKSAIDEYCKTTYDDGFRSHMGASQIGKECKRELWYSFRWMYKPDFDGRMQRVFDRGKREEARFIEWLNGIGCPVCEVDPVTGRQYRVSACEGHFGGSCDGIVNLSAFGGNTTTLVEFKTNGTGKGFNSVLHDGMRIAKPDHFAQISVYGYLTGINECLYCIINKNDDDLHIELVTLDFQLGAMLIEKANGIIFSESAPPRLSENPTFFTCKMCKAFPICHKGEMPVKNCRSCLNAKPVSNAQWECHLYGIIPKEFIPNGCKEWDGIL